MRTSYRDGRRIMEDDPEEWLLEDEVLEIVEMLGAKTPASVISWYREFHLDANISQLNLVLSMSKRILGNVGPQVELCS